MVTLQFVSSLLVQAEIIHSGITLVVKSERREILCNLLVMVWLL